MYVCMYVCNVIYVCMQYVSMYVRTFGRKFLWSGLFTNTAGILFFTYKGMFRFPNLEFVSGIFKAGNASLF